MYLKMFYSKSTFFLLYLFWHDYGSLVIKQRYKIKCCSAVTVQPLKMMWSYNCVTALRLDATSHLCYCSEKAAIDHMYMNKHSWVQWTAKFEFLIFVSQILFFSFFQWYKNVRSILKSQAFRKCMSDLSWPIPDLDHV